MIRLPIDQVRAGDVLHWHEGALIVVDRIIVGGQRHATIHGHSTKSASITIGFQYAQNVTIDRREGNESQTV